MTPRQTIERAIKHFGTQKRLAAAIGYSQHAIWLALSRGRCTPRMAIKIEQASGGKFKRERLVFEPRTPKSTNDDHDAIAQ